MNPYLSETQPYPFEKLAKLKEGVKPPDGLRPIILTVGEPQHPAPEFAKDIIKSSVDLVSKYPLTAGSLELRTAIANWLSRRFRVAPGLIDPDRNVLPCNGTREALFSFAQAVVDPKVNEPLVLMPNPFYQIYEGAAVLAGARPHFINCTRENNWAPDYDSVSEDTWQRCQLLYLCNPGNPTGAVHSYETLSKLVKLAEKYNFVIASDECYSEIYFDDLAPPPGLLEVEAEAGNGKFERCVVFHSLSKRSSLPGMRSGFVAGDAAILEKYKLYRTYHGCAMPPPFQAASTAAWSDERHVVENRALYRKKFDAVLDILQPVMDVARPDAGFYLWARTPINDQEFARRLFERYNLTVLPGSFLSRPSAGIDPGADYVRMALVATQEETIEAARRLRDFITEIKA